MFPRPLLGMLDPPSMKMSYETAIQRRHKYQFHFKYESPPAAVQSSHLSCVVKQMEPMDD
jgi:hypothetical protein